ncbi:MAG: multidrug ABC transporter substrate-binding protein [Tannerellaceae bacterium]|jgi:hypothetical protein|nr:multidrug ABC transporter substrate-binding protein [Tannerellaceae bacterium]
MIKHLVKIIYAQRKSNGWIFAELTIVVAALWYMLDMLYVDMRTYYTPLGYDVTNTWRFKLNKLNPQSPAYVPDSLYSSNQVEDLRQLMAQIRRHPLVEEACITYYSCPYSGGNSWMPISPVEGDTAVASGKNYQVRRVSPEYFGLFRVKDTEGKAIAPQLEGIPDAIVITKDMERLFFHDLSGRGREALCYGEKMTIAAVSASIRDHEYRKSEPALYSILVGEYLSGIVNAMGAENAELCVRMKQTLSQDGINSLLEEMGDQLTVNNLNVYGVRSIADFRESRIRSFRTESRDRLSLMAFLLINVFFGIVGTFWLRTQHRRGESGIRLALGASSLTLKGYLYAEGLCLLALTLPLPLLFAANMISMEVPDLYRLPYTAGRFLITFGGAYLLMAGMICLGVRLPARKLLRLAPAEALRHE